MDPLSTFGDIIDILSSANLNNSIVSNTYIVPLHVCNLTCITCACTLYKDLM